MVMSRPNQRLQPAARGDILGAPRLNRGRYTDKRIPFFASGFFQLSGSARRLGAFVVFSRNAVRSFEHRGDLRHSGVGFVGVVAPNGGAQWLRPTLWLASAWLNRWLSCGGRHAPLRGTRRVVLSWAFCRCSGSIEGPYNHRLHLTAPRGLRSYSVRGEPLASVTLAGSQGVSVDLAVSRFGVVTGVREMGRFAAA